MIYVAGISIALFISALLLNKRGKSKSDFFLFGWMLVMALHLYLFYLNFHENIYNNPQLLGIELPIPLLHGVFLYYYVASVTNQFPKKGWIALLHLIPIIAVYAYLISFFQESNEHKIEVYENRGAPYETFTLVNDILRYLSGIAYVIWSGVLLSRHKRNIQDQFSDIEEVSLKWLQFLTLGLGVIWVIVIFSNSGSFIFVGVSVFIILIGFFGVQQRNIFSDRRPLTHSLPEEQSITKKYAKSGLTSQVAEDVYQSLLVLVSEQSYFKKPDISLNDLAGELAIHPNYLSQIINEKASKSFYDFINAYRVDEFKRLIEIPQNHQFTLMALAYDCGFNSKSSFNRYFKKTTGQTPSEYFKSVTAK